MLRAALSMTGERFDLNRELILTALLMEISTFIFTDDHISFPLRGILLRIAYWVRVISVIGLLFEMIMLLVAADNFWMYHLDDLKHPVITLPHLRTGIAQSMMVAAYIINYVLTYRYSLRLRHALQPLNPNSELIRVFKLWLRILRFNAFILIASAIYYIYILSILAADFSLPF